MFFYILGVNWLTKKDSIFRDFENFISVIFFVILFGPLKLVFRTIWGVYGIVIFILCFMYFLTLLMPGLRDVFFG